MYLVFEQFTVQLGHCCSAHSSLILQWNKRIQNAFKHVLLRDGGFVKKFKLLHHTACYTTHKSCYVWRCTRMSLLPIKSRP